MKKRKAQSNMWWIIIGFIFAAVVMAILIFVFKEGIFKGKDNLDYLSSCEGRGGECKEKCLPGESPFYKFGGCDKEKKKKGDYCCIPESEKKQDDR